MDCADIFISNYAAEGLITTSIDAGNSTDCDEDYSGGFFYAINAGNSMYCANIIVSDDAADGLIDVAIDVGNSTDCAEVAAGE